VSRALLLALALAALAAAGCAKLCVYEVDSDIALDSGALLVPHAPGLEWALGSQLVVIRVPTDVGPGFILFANETASVPIYDPRHFLIAVPACVKLQRGGAAEAVLVTPDGELPVVFRPPSGGIVDITAGSVDEALKILRGAGFEVELRGRARLMARRPALPGPMGAAPAGLPPLGSTLDVYGGVYFRPVRVRAGETVTVPVHGSVSSACTNVDGAAYIGYDARYLMLGVVIRGGDVRGDLIAEVYRIKPGGQCERIATESFILHNMTRFWVSSVNPANSAQYELAVAVKVRARSASGAPVVGVNGSVLYARVYRHGFEVGEMACGVTWGTAVNRRVDRIVIGPCVAYDGLVNGFFAGALSMEVRTDTVNGVCPTLYVEYYMNGRYYYGRYSYSGARVFDTVYLRDVCAYRVSFQSRLDQGEYVYAKSFGGGLFWVLKLSRSSGGAPHVYYVAIDPSDVFRAARWAEQWKTTSGGRIDGVWARPYTSSVYELFTSFTEPRPPMIYHGMVTIRANDRGQIDRRLVITASGRAVDYVNNVVSYVDKFEITVRSSAPVSGTRVSSAYFMSRASLVSLTPKWIELAQRVLDAVNLASILLPDLPSKALGLLTFVAGMALQSASGKAEISIVGSNAFKLKWEMPWFSYNEVSDTLIFMVDLPTGDLTPTELTVTSVVFNRQNIAVSPGLKAYLQPSDPSAYAWISAHSSLKTWMFRGLTPADEIYR
jgi:hypothetical protein